MLHVLLLLLKIPGILLLLLIGLFLLVLLTPIRYSFILEKEEQVSPKFSVRVTWLCWIFYFKTSYIDKVFDYQVRILGRQIAGNQPEFLDKQKERQKRKAEKERARKERENSKEDRKKKPEEKAGRQKESGESEETVKELPVAVTEKKLTIKGKPEEDLLNSDKFNLDISTEEKNSECAGKKGNEDVIPDKASADKSEEKKAKEAKWENGPKEDSEEKKQEKGASFKKFKDKAKNVTNRIKSIKEAKANLDKLPWREWLELGKDILFRLLKHVLPQKLEGSIAFGFDDPANTGYVTGLAAMFYSKYGEHFSLYPDFERKMFAAKCKGRGRIRPGYMLVLVVSILKEKSIRTMIKTIILG